MAIINPVDNLAKAFQTEERKIEKEIVELLLSEEKLDTKTDLGRPIAWSALKVIQDFLAQKKLVLSANTLDLFTKTAFKYLISKDRRGRAEYIEALGMLNKDDKKNNNNLPGLVR
jgi:hypothetical protein